MAKAASRLAASALIVCLALGLPGGLDAKERRGAELAVSTKDGTVSQGELIAVKTDSLLLLDRLTGRDVSVALADIAVIRIVRESKALTGLLVGAVPGIVGGAVWGAHNSDSDMAGLAAIFVGLLGGSVTGLVGLTAGFGMGVDAVVRYADLAENERAAILVGLNRRAREPGVFVPKAAGPAAGETAAVAAPAVRAWTRFRFNWIPAFVGGSAGDPVRTEAIPFRFTESLPPGEAGPYPATDHWADHKRPAFSLGRLSLGYRVTPRLGVEIELSAYKYTIEHLAELRFTSSIDGLTYEAFIGQTQVTEATCLNIGLTYSFLAPATLQPHAVEVGIAAGPAWVRTALAPYLGFLEGLETVYRRTAWTGRARASYDHHFSRSLAMGAFVEYRVLKAALPSLPVLEDLPFSQVPSSGNPALWRTTEVTLPARSLKMGGFACGLRFGFGF